KPADAVGWHHHCRTVFRGGTDPDSPGHHGSQTGKNWRSSGFPDERLAGRYSALDQYCGIIVRPVSLENDLYRQWHQHAGFKFLSARKITEPATPKDQLCSDFQIYGELIKTLTPIGLALSYRCLCFCRHEHAVLDQWPAA